MKQSIKISTTKSYEGSYENMPRWAREEIVPWYRRFLISPLFMAAVIIIGMAANDQDPGFINWLLTMPSFGLFYTVCAEAYHKTMRDEAYKLDTKNKE